MLKCTKAKGKSQAATPVKENNKSANQEPDNPIRLVGISCVAPFQPGSFGLKLKSANKSIRAISSNKRMPASCNAFLNLSERLGCCDIIKNTYGLLPS